MGYKDNDSGLFFVIVIFGVIFGLCSICWKAICRANRAAIYTSPVVITSQTHQPPGASQPYNVQSSRGQLPFLPTSAQSPYQPTVVQSSYQPITVQHAYTPYPSASAPYPTGGNTAPYPTSPASRPMYPPQAASAPPQNISHADDLPPQYNEFMASQANQPAFNPNFQKQ